MKSILYAFGALLCAMPVLADSYRNCGEDWHAVQPSRIVALNQHAADLVLALGAGPALVGVAYLDDTHAGQRPSEYFAVANPPITRSGFCA